MPSSIKANTTTKIMKKITEQDRIDFIRTIVDYHKIDAFLDFSKIKAIKQLMKDYGLYKNRVDEIQDSSVVNLILKAQSKKPMKILKTRVNKRESKRKVYEL